MTRFAPLFKNQDLTWFDEFFKEPTYFNQSTIPVDIKETEKAFSITADLPGMKKEDIHIDFHDGILTIAGAREQKEEKEEGDFHRLERRRGSFTRSFRLGPEVQSDKIEASYADGVLSLSVPKSEATQKRRIEIRASGPKRLE